MGPTEHLNCQATLVFGRLRSTHLLRRYPSAWRHLRQIRLAGNVRYRSEDVRVAVLLGESVGNTRSPSTRHLAEQLQAQCRCISRWGISGAR
jgi:hypothetical protein